MAETAGKNAESVLHNLFELVLYAGAAVVGADILLDFLQEG